MKITDEDLERATQAVANALPNQYKHVAGIVARAALATQTDRYALRARIAFLEGENAVLDAAVKRAKREGFERAREMALQECREYTKDVQSVPGSFTASGCIAASEDLSDAIRNMEMPDETSDNR